jgi:hypothetical protein
MVHFLETTAVGPLGKRALEHAFARWRAHFAWVDALRARVEAAIRVRMWRAYARWRGETAGRVSEALTARVRHYEELLGVDHPAAQLDAALFGIGLLRCELADVEAAWQPPKPRRRIAWKRSVTDHTFASAGQRAECARGAALSDPQLEAYTELREAASIMGRDRIDMSRLRSSAIQRDSVGGFVYRPFETLPRSPERAGAHGARGSPQRRPLSPSVASSRVSPTSPSRAEPPSRQSAHTYTRGSESTPLAARALDDPIDSAFERVRGTEAANRRMRFSPAARVRNVRRPR